MIVNLMPNSDYRLLYGRQYKGHILARQKDHRRQSEEPNSSRNQRQLTDYSGDMAQGSE